MPRLLFLLLLGAAAAQAETWLVAAGVETYQDPGISPLRYGAADARALAEVVAKAGVPADHVRLLVSDGAPEQRPTRTSLRMALRSVRELARAGDTLIFFFAGHGMRQGDELHLLTWDADGESPESMAGTSLAMSEVNDVLRGFAGAHVLFILDACRNDPSASRAAADAMMDESFARVARPRVIAPAGGEPVQGAVLLACEAGQRAWEMPAGGHGVFTHFLLRGLQGEAAEADGTVRLSRLARYLQTEVSAWARNAGKQQTPRLDNPTEQDMELPSAAAAIVRPTLRNQPPELTVEGFTAGQERLLGADEAEATIIGTITDDAGGVSLTAGGQPVGLMPAGPNRWTFVVKVTLEPGQAADVVLEAADAGGLKATATCALRRPRPDVRPAVQPPTPPTSLNKRPANWPEYLRDFQPPQGLTWASFRVSPKDGMPQVLIPAGEFLMGSPPGEAGRTDDEGPQKRVYVSAFWMDVHEVTVAQYARFCQATGRQMDTQFNKTTTHPVVMVSWVDATAYAAWAGRELPTEAQWEKAARGGTTTAYPWGDAFNGTLANNGGGTKRVGSYAPNRSGLFDMIGNVFEWCRDTYEEDWYRRMPARDPFNAGNTDSSPVLRGGSWGGSPVYQRVANRDRATPGTRGGDLGFRCAEAP